MLQTWCATFGEERMFDVMAPCVIDMMSGFLHFPKLFVWMEVARLMIRGSLFLV